VRWLRETRGIIFSHDKAPSLLDVLHRKHGMRVEIWPGIAPALRREGLL